MERTYRFGELVKVMPTITKHVLTVQLRELEADGLIHREVYASVPLRLNIHSLRTVRVCGK
ncbi:MAG: winged helix-turn-helix transcriptional regulator [Spirochaetales bacterium]|uniref:Winged helix-turn-helix transcriptional regulator n=1 Tax=Candidatus Thalassospirochaeta sargassi TaxID=3119039 RepID=A0AAJ1MKE4_9SPIO|nr:winged helix-turn-helix transcriptional regulator [Spirochaetales bacterium]